MRPTDLVFSWQGAVLAEFLLTWLVIYFALMRPRKKPKPQRANSRFYNRYPSRFKGWLLFNGEKHSIRGVDLNNSGALVKSRLPLTPGDDVFLYLASARLMGWAEVRHCIPRQTYGYNVGVAFRGPLMRATEGDWEFHQQREAQTN